MKSTVGMVSYAEGTVELLTLIYTAVGRYNNHSFEWPFLFFPKVLMYKYSKTICIPRLKYCFYTKIFIVMNQWWFNKFLSTFLNSEIEYHICTQAQSPCKRGF